MEIMIDDRSTTLKELVLQNSYSLFREKWLSLAEAQGFQLGNSSPFLVLNRYLDLKDRLLHDDFISPHMVTHAAKVISEAVANLGLITPETLRIVLCLGAGFNGRSSGGKIFISIDRCNPNNFFGILVHELAHIAMPPESLYCLPLNIDRRLWLEAISIWATKRIAGCSDAEATDIDEANLQDMRNSLQLLKTEFTRARVNQPPLCEDLPTDPFLGSFDEGPRFCRYGYFLALEFISKMNDQELSVAFTNPQLPSKWIKDYFSLPDHSEARIISDSDEYSLEHVPPYSILTESRLQSWEGRFPWLQTYKYLEMENEIPNKSILDICCGTGHILSKISSHYSRLVGIDRCEAMLKRAQDKLPQAELIRADAILWKSDELFELVVCSFDSVNHIAAQHGVSKALETIGKNVCPKGALVFDFLTTAAFRGNVGSRVTGDGGWRILELNEWFPKKCMNRSLAYIISPQSSRRIFLEVHYEVPIQINEVHHHLTRLGYDKIYMHDFSRPSNPAHALSTRVMTLAFRKRIAN